MAWTGYSEQGSGSQERGPGRFALQVPGAPQRRAMPTPDAVQGGIRGGGISGGLSIGPNDLNINTPAPSRPVAPDPTFTALMKIGGEFFAAKVKELEQRKFVEGMTKAASGQALLEIVNERPEWARVFGDGGAAEGARAYATEAAVSQWASQVQEAMPTLRQQSPDRIPDLLQEMGKGLLTGDEQADSAIRMAMLKNIPALVKAHTREHVAWQQEEAVAQQANAFTSAGTLADKKLRDPKATDDDRAAAITDLFASLSFTPGMNPESYVKNLGGFVKSAAQNNQFQMLQGLQDRGLLAALPPETGAQLTSYIREQAKRYRSDQPPQALVVEANMVMAQMESGVIGAQDGINELNAINQRYMRESGNIIPLLDPDVIGGSVQQTAKANYAWRRQETERLARERAAAAEVGNAAQVELARTDKLVGAAAVGAVYHVVATDSEKKDAVAGAWRRAAGTPQGYFALIENHRVGNIVSDYVQQDMQRDWRGREQATPGPNFVTAYSKWRDFNFLRDAEGRLTPRAVGVGPASAAYFGAEQDGAMRTFHDLTMQGGRVDDPAISDMAFKAATGPRPAPLDKAGKKELTSALKGALGSDDKVAAQVMEHILPYAQHYARMGHEGAAVQGLAAARAAGLEVWGSAVMMRSTDQPPLDSALGIPTTEVGTVLADTIAARIKDERFKGAAVASWQRVPGKGVNVRALIQDEDGTPHTVVLTGDDLKAFWNKKQERDAEGMLSGMPKFGPKITYTNAEGFPGIYASPEALRAWRAKQGK